MNEAKENRETRTIEQGPDAEAASLIEKAGGIVQPPGLVLVGSAALFYYKHAFTLEPTYSVAQLLSLQAVEEGFADYGWKELRKAMMNQYGREAPKRRR